VHGTGPLWVLVMLLPSAGKGASLRYTVAPIYKLWHYDGTFASMGISSTRLCCAARCQKRCFQKRA